MTLLMQPTWLLALGIIPLIRYWHRRNAPLFLQYVSAVFLWRTKLPENTGGGHQSPPDPAWRRRALIASLLIIALADPYIELEDEKIVVWIDDSPSMQTIENGQTRMAAAMGTLELALGDRDRASISKHLLGDPPFASIDEQNRNWLVTDGASKRIREWAAAASFEKLISVGTASNNSAVTLLSLRRSLAQDDLNEVLVVFNNSGDDVDERSAKLYAGDQLLATRTVLLRPRQSEHWSTRIPAGIEPLTVRLEPGDALQQDDELIIPAAKLTPLRLDLAANCPAALRTALTVHPALDTRPGAGTDLLVSCSNGLPDESGTAAESHPAAHIHLLQGMSLPVSAAPVWLPFRLSQDAPQLPLENLRATGWPASLPMGEQQVLLQAGDKPLILLTRSKNGGSTTVMTVIDLEQPEFAQQPEFAALVATLVDAAVGKATLDVIVKQQREIDETVIRPGDIETVSPSRTTQRSHNSTSLILPLLLASMLLVMLDTLMLLRVRRRTANA